MLRTADTVCVSNIPLSLNVRDRQKTYQSKVNIFVDVDEE